jgi:histidinol-phosphate aminotransferase
MNSLRPHLDRLPPYSPIEPFEVLSDKLGLPVDQIVKLDANENPFGLTDKIRAALQNMAHAHIYPDPESRMLRHALANFTEAPEKNILAGSGADELIDLIMRVCLDPKDYILNLPPTFGMYSFDAQVNAGQVIDIPRFPDFTIDLDAITTAVTQYRPKLIFIANPNNPDGSLLTKTLINRLLELPVITVLDEAYIEFAEPLSCGNEISFCHQAHQRENLIVLRTFSKWAGLAGLRVGYGCFPDWMMPTLWKTKQPYNVNVAASTAALAAIEDLQTLTSRLNKITDSRRYLYQALQKFPYLEPYPSHANFVLCKVSRIPAEHLKDRLAKDFGILIRYFDKPDLQDHIRISVGRDEHIQALLHALNKIGEEL